MRRIAPLEIGQPPQCCLGRCQPRAGLLRVRAADGDDAETADDIREREALADERRQDHAERQEDDEVPVGERRIERQREGGRERDGAAHAGPGDHEDSLRRG